MLDTLGRRGLRRLGGLGLLAVRVAGLRSAVQKTPIDADYALVADIAPPPCSQTKA